MPREKLELAALPAAMDEVAGKQASFSRQIGVTGLTLFAFVVLISVFNVVGLPQTLVLGFGLVFAGMVGIWWLGSRHRNRNALAAAADAARKQRLPAEALAALEACARHRRRIHAVADDIASAGSHYAPIGEDARRVADEELRRALMACAPLAGRRTGRRGILAKAMEELLDGDLDDAVEALVKRKDEVYVDSQRMPSEILPVVEIARGLQRLASELEGHRPAVRTTRTASEADDLIERLRLTREAEQELHRDLNA